MGLVEISLIDYLLSSSPADATVDAIVERVGAQPAARVFPGHLPQEPCFPAITYFLFSSDHDELLDGTESLAFARYQFSCWARTPIEAWELAALVRMRMTGPGGDGFQKAGILDERDESPMFDPDVMAYRRDVEVQIAFAESSPE